MATARPDAAVPALTGYLHPDYAASFAADGAVRSLPACGGWLIERAIPGSDARDAMGCYPLFACRDWSQLGPDLEQIGSALVSVTLVTDPFGAYDEPLLARAFDRVVPYKQHYVADLTRPAGEFVTADRRQCAATARRRGVTVEEVAQPSDCIDEWTALYLGAMARHDAPGPVLTRETVLAQLRLPGLVMLRAIWHTQTVGLGLFAVHNDVAYAHLVALGERAHELRVSCALYDDAIERLAGRVRWIDWGGVAGSSDNPNGGLARFKSGWSSGQRTAFLCMRILDRDQYAALSGTTGRTGSTYLPAYRGPAPTGD